MCETPSICEHKNWVYAYPPDSDGFEFLTEVLGNYEGDLQLKGGKWVIYENRGRVDAIWELIKKATQSGELGIGSKAATKIESDFYGGKSHAICVFTRNWKDKKDVRMVRERLRGLGITQRIPYKANEDTRHGKYKFNSSERISKYYE